MKTILLFSFMFCLANGIAQIKLQSVTNYQYDDFGALVNIDSTAYVYNGVDGNLDSLKHQFDFFLDGNSFGHHVPIESTFVDFTNTYSGANHPLPYLFSSQNIYSNGQLISYENLNYRDLFTYDTNGNLSTHEKQEYQTNWIPSESETYTYNSNNKILTIQRYFAIPLGSPLYLAQIDSISYDNINNEQISEIKRYNISGGIGTLISLKSFFYSNNLPDYIDFYELQNNNLLWVRHTSFSFFDGLITEFANYEVVSDVIQQTPETSVNYEYYSQNSLLKKEITSVYNQVNTTTDYTYYDANFLKDIRLNFANADGDLIEKGILTFYYSGSLGLFENEQISVSVCQNPTNDFIQIKSEFPITKVEVKNMAGQLLLVQNSGNIDLSHLPSGTYFVQGETEKGNFIEKVVKL